LALDALRTPAYLLANAGADGVGLEELRLRRLNELVRHAYEHVRYHRQRFEQARLLPKDIRCLGDLRRLRVTPATDGEQEAEMRFVEHIPVTAAYKERAVVALPLGDDSPG